MQRQQFNMLSKENKSECLLYLLTEELTFCFSGQNIHHHGWGEGVSCLSGRAGFR